MARSIHSASSGAVLATSLMMGCLLLIIAPAAVQATVVCENHGSGDPTLSDAQSKANTLIGYPTGTQCCQTNNGGNFCTVMLFAGPGYEVRICGPYNQCMGCADAGGLTWEIINQCQRNDNGVIRVSGYNNGKAPFTIVLRNNAN